MQITISDTEPSATVKAHSDVWLNKSLIEQEEQLAVLKEKPREVFNTV